MNNINKMAKRSTNLNMFGFPSPKFDQTIFAKIAIWAE
jgi:hypothetical protein